MRASNFKRQNHVVKMQHEPKEYLDKFVIPIDTSVIGLIQNGVQTKRQKNYSGDTIDLGFSSLQEIHKMAIENKTYISKLEFQNKMELEREKVFRENESKKDIINE